MKTSPNCDKIGSMTDAYSQLLLIEDDPAVARGLQDGLERDGFRISGMPTGAEGIEFLRKNAPYPHLILLDVRLPDSSGFDICRRMHQMGLRQPIILLTVQREEMDKVLGLEMGADDYVTKPFSLRELLSRIRAQLRRAYPDTRAAVWAWLWSKRSPRPTAEV